MEFYQELMRCSRLLVYKSIEFKHFAAPQEKSRSDVSERDQLNQIIT